MQAIELRNINKTFKKFQALKDLSFSVEEGSFFGFVGPNGVGKSTSIRILLNMFFPDEGSAKIFGLDCIKESKKIKTLTSYVSSDVLLYPEMTVEQLLKITTAFYKIKFTQREFDYYYEKFEISPKKKLGSLSFGNKKKVSLIASFISKPRLLILDEPTNGLDPLMQHRFFDELKKLNRQGATIFLSSHDLYEVQNYCSKAAFIKEGSILLQEKIQKSEESEKVFILKGNNIDYQDFITAGCTMLQSDHEGIRLLAKKNIPEILKMVADKWRLVEDFEVRNLSLEDKFLSLYEKKEDTQ